MYSTNTVRSALPLVVASAAVILAVVNFEHLRKDDVLIVLAALILLTSLGSALDLILHYIRGPRSYAVDALGLWRGRGERFKLHLRWEDVKSWSVRYSRGGKPSWRFDTEQRAFFVRYNEVELPSFETFAADAEARIGNPAEVR